MDEREKERIMDMIEEMFGSVPIRIKYVSDIGKPVQAHDGEWIDLRAARDVKLKAFESVLIPLGIKTELPTGYEAHVVPRSGTFKKYKIIQTNGVGIIDETYRGQWHMPVIAMSDTFIPKGERICQFRIVQHQPRIILREVSELSETERGENGFGSTGRT